jgi:hypothetical protein
MRLDQFGARRQLAVDLGSTPLVRTRILQSTIQEESIALRARRARRLVEN